MATPLTTLRRYQFAFFVFFGVLLMIVFVVGDPLYSWLGGNSSRGNRQNDKKVVAWRGGNEMTESELYNEKVTRNIVREFVSAVFEETRKRNGSPQIRTQLSLSPRDRDIVYSKVLATQAEQMGLEVNDETALQYLEKLSADLIPRGEIGRIFHDVVGNRITEQQMLNTIKTELAAQNYIALTYPDLTRGNLPAQAWENYRRLNRRVKAEIAPLDVSEFKKKITKEPTQAEITALYESAKERYPEPALPEPGFKRRKKVSFDFIRADRKKFEDEEFAKLRPQVTDQEVTEYYEKNKDEFRETPPAQQPPSDGTVPPATPSAEKPADTAKPAEGDKKSGEATSPPADKPADPAAPADSAGKPDEKKTEEPAKPAEPSPTPEAKPGTNEPSTSDSKPNEPAKPDEPAKEESTKPESSCQEEAVKDEAKTEEKPATEKPAEPRATPDAAPADNSAKPQEPAKEADKPAAEPAKDTAAPEKPAADASKPAEQPTDKPAAQPDKPADQPAATDVPAAPEKPKADAAPPPSYKPLDDKLRDEIRDRVARQKATRAAQERVDAGLNEIRRLIAKYAQQKRSAELKSTKPPEPLDLKKIAAERGMEFGQIPLSDSLEVQNFELGKTFEFDFSSMQMQRIPFDLLGYRDNLSPYKPEEIRGEKFEIHFLYWKTGEEAPFVPELKDIHAEVVEAWKQREAFALAQAEAKALAEKARKAGTSLAESLKQDNLKVTETNQFSWLTAGSVPMGMGMGMPALSSVDGVDHAGQEFMQPVLSLKAGEVGVAVNQPHTVVYVVRIVSEIPSDEVLREMFLQTGTSMELMQVAQMERGEIQRNWIEQVERDMGVKWERTPEG